MNIQDLELTDIAQLLFREARLLDERRFEEWLELYTDDAYVWVPAGNAEREHHISLVNDDRELMEVRVRRLRHPAVHSQLPPAKASRIISNVFLDSHAENGDLVVGSCFVMVECRLKEQRVFAGHYLHHLRYVDDAWKIAAKKVDLVNSDGVFANLGLPL